MKETYQSDNDFLLSAVQRGDQKRSIHCFGDIIRCCARMVTGLSSWKMQKRL